MTLVDLIQQDIALTKRGKEWVGLCPFHQEKTPSLTVSAERGLYYCFGCSRGGDAITWLRNYRHLSFRDACRIVGKRLAPLTLAATKTPKALRVERIDRELEAEFLAWEKLHLCCWTDRHRELLALQAIAEMGYRATVRCPDLYTEAEKLFWERSLSDFYNALEEEAFIPTMCDLFTYEEHREERFTWWDVKTAKETLDRQR